MEQIIDTSVELREAVFSIQTNYIFKSMLSNVGRDYREELVKFLKIDVQNVEPIYFNRQKYKAKDHQNNIFLYIDSEFKLIGILEGSTWEKDWERYESYDMKRSYHGEHSKAVIKNRSNMEKLSSHILMITSEMRLSFKKRVTIKAKPRFIKDRDAYQLLERRLKTYKLKKHSVTNEEAKQICKDLISYFVPHMFNEEQEKELVGKKPASRWFSIKSISELIRDVADLSGKIEESIKQSKGNYYSSDYAKRELNELKVEIINYRNAYLKDEN